LLTKNLEPGGVSLRGWTAARLGVHDDDPGQTQGLRLRGIREPRRQIGPKRALGTELPLGAADGPERRRVADQPPQLRLQLLHVLQLGPVDLLDQLPHHPGQLPQ
jgi:hypothetical protein